MRHTRENRRITVEVWQRHPDCFMARVSEGLSPFEFHPVIGYVRTPHEAVTMLLAELSKRHIHGVAHVVRS